MNRAYISWITTLFSICILHMPIAMLAQISVEKVVVDAKFNNPLPNAHIVASDTVVFTDENGVFALNIEGDIEIFHLGFENIRFEENDVIPDTIKLIRKNTVIQEITIRAERIVGEIEKEKKYWIKDFEIVYDHLVVLKKTHFRGHTKLALHNLDGEYLNEFKFEHEIESIHLNCLGQLFVRHEHGYVLVFVSNNRLVAGPEYSRRKYEQVFKNCVLYQNGTWVYEFERFRGLERNIVTIQNHKDSLLKKISLPQLVALNRNYRGSIVRGSDVSSMQVTDDKQNRSIRRMQATSAFMDQVLLKAHEKNSFAILNDGILIANSILDSLHHYSNQLTERAFEIRKRDYIFNNTDNSRAFFFQSNGLKDYSVKEIGENLECQKLLSINEHVNKIKVCGNKIFYLVRDNQKNAVKTKIYYEYL